jgi:Xaa-Pro aminopeptidase
MNKRLRRVQQSLARHNLAALLVRVFEEDNHNVRYLSGFGGTTAHLVVTPRKALIIADARYFARAREEAPDFKLVKIDRAKKVSDHINEALAHCRLTRASRVGFEAEHISVEHARRWRQELKCKLVPTVHLVERFRQYKDDEEIEQVRKACRITSRVFQEVLPLIASGMSELDVAFELDMRLRKHGALNTSFATIVASGPNAAHPHHATGARRLKAGEAVIIDFGGLFPGGYCSDITRTVFVPGKKPSKQMVEIYKIVLGANRAARKALVPGMKWRAYDGVAREYISKYGFGKYFTHGLGHSVGLAVHDPFDYEKDPFAVGTIMTDEPGIYIEGLGGVRIEDDLVVTTSGAERLTPAPYWQF